MRLSESILMLAAIAASQSCSGSCGQEEEEVPLPPRLSEQDDTQAGVSDDAFGQDGEVMDFGDWTDEQLATLDGLEGEVLDFTEVDMDFSTDMQAGEEVLHAKGRRNVHKMLSVCAKQQQTFLKGYGRLHAIAPYWIALGMNDGIVYVRGGTTSSDGNSCSHRAQLDFILQRIPRFFPAYKRPAECQRGKTRPRGGRSCKTALSDDYQRMMVDHYSGRYFCADCTTFLMQMFECAWGKTQHFRTNPLTMPIIAASPNAIKGYTYDQRLKGKRAVFNSWTGKGGSRHWGYRSQPDMGTCWDVIDDQLGGQLQFGDLIQFPGHYAIYVGGVGLDYELAEVGAYKFTNTEIATADISIRFNGKTPGSMRVMKSAKQTLTGEYVRRGCAIRRAGPQPWQVDYREINKRNYARRRR